MTRTPVTEKMLRAVGVSPTAALLYAPVIDAALVEPDDSFNKITSRNGVCMFVAQTAHESLRYTLMTENLNYSSEALAAMTDGNSRRYFTDAEARAFGYNAEHRANPVAIANILYANRNGNGDRNSGDGWRYRGGGPLQLTGKSNYAAFGATRGMTPEQAADYVRTVQGGIEAALWYWRLPSNGILVPASQGDVPTVSRIVNGGPGKRNNQRFIPNGLADRIKKFNLCLAATQ